VAITMTQRHLPAHRATSQFSSGRGSVTATSTDGLPWYRRGKALLVGAGALAGACLALLGLWDRIFPADPGDVARIESVDLLGQSSFKEFSDGQFGVEFPLEPAPAGAAATAHVVLPVTGPDGAATEALPGTIPEPFRRVMLSRGFTLRSRRQLLRSPTCSRSRRRLGRTWTRNRSRK